MMRRPGYALPVLLFALLLLLPLLAGGLLLGRDRAVRIAASGMASTLLDGFHQRSEEHRIPVVDVEVDPAQLRRLGADLPWSSTERIPAVLRHGGIDYPGTFKFRGAFATTHYLGRKRSFRLNLKRDNPFAPYRRLNFINPKSHNLLNARMALWVAAQVGVLVPFDEMVFVRLNGNDQGVMELYEQVGGDFLRNRHLAVGDAPVFRGDHAPVTGRERPESRPLWADAAHWSFMGDADSSEARVRLEALVTLLHGPGDEALLRDSLPRLIDADAFLRFCAAIALVGTTHIDNYHNQWLVMDPASRLFHPVFWDALMLYQPRDAAYYAIHDAMAFHLLRDAGRRLQRDRYIHEGIRRVLHNNAFTTQLDAELERLRPSVLADRNLYGVVSDDAHDVFRTSALHFAASADVLREAVDRHLHALAEQQRIGDLVVQRADRGMQFSWSGASALRVQWEGAEKDRPEVEGASPVVFLHWIDGQWTLVLGTPVVHSDGASASPLSDGRAWRSAPSQATLRFADALPATLLFTNAVTDELLHARN